MTHRLQAIHRSQAGPRRAARPLASPASLASLEQASRRAQVVSRPAHLHHLAPTSPCPQPTPVQKSGLAEAAAPEGPALLEGAVQQGPVGAAQGVPSGIPEALPAGAAAWREAGAAAWREAEVAAPEGPVAQEEGAVAAVPPPTQRLRTSNRNGHRTSLYPGSPHHRIHISCAPLKALVRRCHAVLVTSGRNSSFNTPWS